MDPLKELETKRQRGVVNPVRDVQLQNEGWKVLLTLGQPDNSLCVANISQNICPWFLDEHLYNLNWTVLMNPCTQPSTVYLTPVQLQTNLDRGGAELLKRYRNIVPFFRGIWINRVIDFIRSTNEVEVMLMRKLQNWTIDLNTFLSWQSGRRPAGRHPQWNHSL